MRPPLLRPTAPSAWLAAAATVWRPSSLARCGGRLPPPTTTARPTQQQQPCWRLPRTDGPPAAGTARQRRTFATPAPVEPSTASRRTTTEEGPPPTAGNAPAPASSSSDPAIALPSPSPPPSDDPTSSSALTSSGRDLDTSDLALSVSYGAPSRPQEEARPASSAEPPSSAAQDSVASPPRAPSADPSPAPPHLVQSPSWRPPFPLPTDLSTLLFRLRSLRLSTAHLVRGQLAASLERAGAAVEHAKARAEEERVRLLTAGKLVFGQVGGKVNSVTGYDGIERLKEGVRVQELALTELRAALTAAKTTYHQALTSSSASQRELNDLLQRKHSWATADVERFTALVRSDHESSAAAAQAKSAVERLEGEADRAFDGLLRAILQRYHEEQTWSDKLRSLSSYTQLLVLGVNALLFLGAVAVVEPWKRRRMVEGFEGRVREMSDGLGQTVRDEVDALRRELGALRSPAATAAAAGVATPEPTPAPPTTLADDPAALPLPSVAHLVGALAPSPASPADLSPRPPLLIPHPTFPYHYPSPALLALPSRAASSVKTACKAAWHDAGSAERGLAIAASVGLGVGAVVVALFKG